MSVSKTFIKKYSKIFVSLKLLIVISIVFQNCAQPLDEAYLDEQGAEQNSEGETLFSDVDLAYRASIDTIAYMSCSGTSAKNVFTIKAAANRPGSGVSLNEEFSLRTKIHSAKSFAGVLAADEYNRTATLQLSLRKRAEPLRLEETAGSGAIGADINYFFGASPLNDFYMASELHRLSNDDNNANDKFVRYLRNKPTTTLTEDNYRNFESSLSIVKDETKSRDLRSALAGTSSLTLAFSPGYKDLASLMGSGTTSSPKLFGKSYALGIDNTYTRTSSRQLSSIIESNLKDNTPGPSWSCPADLKFIIYRKKDAHLCGGGSDFVDSNGVDRNLTNAQKATLHYARTIIDPTGNKWFIKYRPGGGCMYPKSEEVVCYGYSQGSNYDPDGPTAIKYSDPSSCNVDATGADDPRPCPHFASVCTRSQ